jgi:hypothetical protein
VYKSLSVQCTGLKKAGSAKAPTTKRCVVAYCSRCLHHRYNEDMSDIIAQSEACEGHVHDAGYTWSCPSCRGICNCSVCRKKTGLAPLGYASFSTLANSEHLRNPVQLRLRRKILLKRPRPDHRSSTPILIMEFNHSSKRQRQKMRQQMALTFPSKSISRPWLFLKLSLPNLQPHGGPRNLR